MPSSPVIPDGRGTNGLLRVMSNEDIDRQDRRSKEAIEKSQNQPVVLNLASHLKNHWDAAKTAKWPVEERLVACLRARKGIYNPEDLAAIRQFGGSEVYMMLTNVKCRTIEAWAKDVLLPAGEKPWNISPTPDPDLPQNEEAMIVQQVESEVTEIISNIGPGVITPDMVDERLAEVRDEMLTKKRKIASRQALSVENKIEDIFQEGGFYSEMAKFIKDFSTYMTAFLKGPEVRRKKVLEWQEDETGKVVPVASSKLVRVYRRVSPFDMYPSPGSKSLDDGYFFERMRVRQKDLVAMKGVDGFDTAAIDEVLLRHKSGALNDWLWTDQERANLESRPNELMDPTARIEVLEYHGYVQGDLLIEWGMSPAKIKNPANPVPVVAMLVDNWVIMARINDDPMEQTRYYAASFEFSNDSIWGEAPTELMEDCQRVCNATARALVNNTAIASGPQVEVHKDRLDGTEDIEELYPWKVWKTISDPLGHNREAVHFYQPNILTDSLMRVFNFFFGQAGEQIGVPAYEAGVGNAAGGAGKTAHGLSMLMTAASKIMKDAIVAIDSNVIKPTVKNTWIDVLLYDDVDYRGDINVVARASEYLIVAEQLQARRNEWLMATNNPVDLEIITMPNRAKVLRESAKTLKLNDDVVPPQIEVEQKFGMVQQPGQVPMVGPDGQPIPTGGGGAPSGAPGGPGMLPQQGALQEQLTPPLERMSNM